MSGYMEMFSLVGRTAVVTGGSRGIGRAISIGLQAAGARVVSLARSSVPPGEAPRGIAQRVCNVVDLAAFESVVEEFLAGEALHVLVNAAGITRPGGSLASFDETIAVNLRAPYQTSIAAARLMGNTNEGSIINVTSLAAWRGFPGNPAYIASKGGLSQLTRALAYDLGAKGIRVKI